MSLTFNETGTPANLLVTLPDNAVDANYQVILSALDVNDIFKYNIENISFPKMWQKFQDNKTDAEVTTFEIEEAPPGSLLFNLHGAGICIVTKKV